jgi:hypothetical protein
MNPHAAKRGTRFGFFAGAGLISSSSLLISAVSRRVTVSVGAQPISSQGEFVMVINARAGSYRSSCGRTTALVAAAAAAVVGIAASTPAASAAPPEPFLFSYAFDGHLKLGGGNFTMNGEVRVFLRFSPQNTFWSQSVIARPHQVTPGGAIYVETRSAAPCPPGNNGYARALDVATNRWSPRLPVTICVPIDNGPALHPVGG